MSQRKQASDRFKWVVVYALLLISIGLSIYYVRKPVYLHLLGAAFISPLIAGVALTTAKGKEVCSFVEEAYSEMKQVVWPTRSATLQLTFVIVLMVTLVSVLIFCFDQMLAWLLSRLTTGG